MVAVNDISNCLRNVKVFWGSLGGFVRIRILRIMRIFRIRTMHQHRHVIADLIRPFIRTRTIRRKRLCAASAHAGTA